MGNGLSTLPLYLQLENKLKNQIVSGRLKPGKRIPSIRNLADKYKVSDITVRKAISNLCNQGLLSARLGHGTFVDEKHEKRSTNKLIGLLLRSEGHLYDNLCMSLVRNFQNNGYHSLVADAGPLGKNPDNFPDIVKDLLNNDPTAFVFDGDYEFKRECLLVDDRPPENVTIILRDEQQSEKSIEFKANKVLSDDCYGGYLATKQLLCSGHKKILFIVPLAKVMDNDSSTVRALDGCKNAYEEKGYSLSADALFIRVKDSRENIRRLEGILKKRNRPTAVFAFGDAYVREVYKAAQLTGLRIPEDLAVIGYFNTPWADMLDIPITSVSIREDEIVKIAVDKTVEKIENPDSPNETIMVKPELIIRESCGTKDNP